MATKAYGGTVLTGGGTGALDRAELDGDILNDLDLALVNTAGILYPYQLDADSAVAEISPSVISPDVNPGDKRWVLQGMRLANLGIGTDPPSSGLSVVTIKRAGSTGRVAIGSQNSTRGAIWINQSTPSTTNYVLSADISGNTFFNATGGIRIQISNSIHFSFFSKKFDLGAGQTHCDLSFPSTNGTKLGTTTSQKLAFWDTTPVAQPAHIADPTGGSTVDAEARTVINSILAQLATIGLQAAA